ncbi:hypothetical protein [Pseudomonas sp. S1(2024)]|uniref:hypothetical protein n=1 Tax=Pseudomonas sp. S1(2024) TaxID=3390191 RepID=UPI00397DFB46
MKRDRAMEELRALVLANNPHLTSAELEKLTDLQVLERVRNSFIVDDPGRSSNEWEVDMSIALEESAQDLKYHGLAPF